MVEYYQGRRMYKVPSILLVKARDFPLIVVKQKLCCIKYSRI